MKTWFYIFLAVALLFAVFCCVWIPPKISRFARFDSKPSLKRVALFDPHTLPKFQNVLPMLVDLEVPGETTIVLRAQRGTAWMGLRSPQGKKLRTPIWGFSHNGSPVFSPGPTLNVEKGTNVYVRWENDLPKGPHLLPVDTTIHVAQGYDPQTGSLPIVMHLHGGHTQWESDGHPEAWFTQQNKKKGKMYRKATYTYDNSEDATLLWYHDHTMALTRLNNYAGLVGLYVIKDDTERRLHQAGLLPLPSETLNLLIADRLFTTDGNIYYPGIHGDPTSLVAIEPKWPNPTQLHEFWGKFITVNGMCWPRIPVQSRPYRLRLLNASDTRTYVLGFRNRLPFYKVGTDGGFLNTPVILTQLVLAPAQRVDLVIDFSQWAGEKLVLENRGGDVLFKGFVPPPHPELSATVVPEPDLVLSDGKGGVVDRTDASTTGLVMRFDVGSDSYAPSPLSGATVLRIPPLTLPFPVDRVRRLALFKGEDSFGRNLLLLGTLAKGSHLWSDRATEIVGLYTTEIWEIYNATVSGHPIHLHLVEFQVLDRQPFKGTVVPKYHKDHHGRRLKGGKLRDVKLVGTSKLSAPGEPKDTVVSLPGQVTRIIAHFDRPGHYVWHCHLLSHEDWDMMRPLEIRDRSRRRPRSGAPDVPSPKGPDVGNSFTHSKT